MQRVHNIYKEMNETFIKTQENNNQPNSYADSDQIKFGSGIYLTREDEKEHKISWEDEDNAEP